MLARVRTGSVHGVDAMMVEVEVALASALPSFHVVGLAQGSVREGRERVAAALRSSGYGLPNRRITVNLAPAGVRKEGTAFDLPIAVGILAAAGQVAVAATEGVAFTGELGLDGSLRPVRAVLPVTLRARDEGMRAIVVPSGNAEEAAMVGGIDVVPAACLAEVVAHLRGEAPVGGDRQETGPERSPLSSMDQRSTRLDLLDVRGQQAAKRALEIAAAGAHNLLMIGPPGAGKTMLARRLPGLLPPLGVEEAIEVARIHSVAGLLTGTRPSRVRPFRAPHHSVSYAGLVGGGAPVRPGEVSLAHLGVLFLDELPEYGRNVIEVLRQPLEEGCVTLARASGGVVFPARFQLVAAMNPCPCGYHGSADDRCLCDPAIVARYRARVSGPLLDRIDIVIEVPPVRAGELVGGDRGTDGVARSGGPSSREVAAKVAAVRSMRIRNPDRTDGFRVAGMSSGARRLLERAIAGGALSARGHDRVMRVARTIADLAGCERVASEHVAEALQYRASGR